MTLEDLLTANTKALEANTAALLAANEGRQAALEKATELAAGGATTTRKPRTTKTEEPGNTTPPPAEAPPKTLTPDDLRAAGAKFLNPELDPAALEGRKGFVRTLLTEFSVGKFVDIPAASYGDVIGRLDTYQDAAPAAEADDDLMG